MKFTGKVVHGVQVGSKFGIATANLELGTTPDLEEGVYLVDLDNNLEGIMHFGELKTFGAGFSAEVHILDFQDDIYGDLLTVNVLKKLREVVHFPNSDALFTQIEKDIVQAEKYFLRRQIKNQWRTVNSKQQTDWAEKAISEIEKLPEFKSAKTIYAYAPDDQEIPFVENLCKKNSDKTWCFPSITEGVMTFSSVNNYSDLKPGYLDLLEPPRTRVQSKSTLENPGSSPDLILVPTVAASPAGQRLGRGGGFYDQFLSKQSPLKRGIQGVLTIAVLPDFAIQDEIPCEAHDKNVSIVIKC